MNGNKMTVAGAVILYNPDTSVIKNIESYINFLDCLFIINNGNGQSVIDGLLEKYSNIYIINEKENKGIAFPLNQVLHLCKEKYDFLMTMDQDSCYVPDSIERYIKEISNFDWTKTLGIAPKKITYQEKVPYESLVKWQKVFRLITSGNIVNVSNALFIGGYNENLFIDEVDHEFCYRGILHGFESYECLNGIFLKHSIGNTLTISTSLHTFYSLNHSPIRKYYIVRNRLFIYKKYHRLNEIWFFKEYIVSTIKYILKILLFEKQKIKKLQFCFWGFTDFLNNKTGKYAE